MAIARAVKAVGCQPSGWTVAVTEQWDETCRGRGGVDLITVETIGNISENNTLRQGRPMRVAHLAHITSIANQDATSI